MVATAEGLKLSTGQRQSGARKSEYTLPLLPALVVLLVGAWAIAFDGFQYLGVEKAFGSTFVDLRYLTATAECYRADSNWSLMSPTCDPFGRLNNYPSPWVWLFAFSGVTEAHTVAIAWTYLAIFSASIWLISWGAMRDSERPRFSIIAVTVIAISPPTWLALERGSNEILIFAALSIAWFAFTLRNTKTSSLIIALLTILKFFPAGAMIVFRPKLKMRKLEILLFSCITLLGLIMISPELNLIRQRTPQPSEAAFGAALLMRQAQLPLGRIFGLLVFTVVLVVFMVWLAKSRNSMLKMNFLRLQSHLALDARAWALFAFGAGPLVLAYLMGTNYDYRLILAIPVVAGLSRLSNLFLSRVLTVVLISSTFFSYQVLTQLQVAGDVVWLLTFPILAILLAGAWKIDPKSRRIAPVN